MRQEMRKIIQAHLPQHRLTKGMHLASDGCKRLKAARKRISRRGSGAPSGVSDNLEIDIVGQTSKDVPRGCNCERRGTGRVLGMLVLFGCHSIKSTLRSKSRIAALQLGGLMTGCEKFFFFSWFLTSSK